jgi:dipeptidyl aminopeptidase/acylaminoacyl peptidase
VKIWILAAIIILHLAAPLFAAGRPITIDDLLAIKGVSDPQLSPDGSSVVYVVSEIDRSTDKTNTSLWLVPASGGEPKRLTTTPGTNNSPRWSPDGRTVAFISSLPRPDARADRREGQGEGSLQKQGPHV